MNPQTTNVVSIMPLKNRADKIRGLMHDMASNTLSIGCELVEAYDDPNQFPIGPNGQHMGFRKWLKEEVQISNTHAYAMMAAYRKFGCTAPPYTLPSMRVLQFLSRSTTPEEARDEVMKRVAQGETVGRGQAEKIAKEHRPQERRPSPKQAIKRAQETGKAVVASDNYLYMGGSQEEIKEATFKRTLTYAVKDAIATLAQMRWTPVEFIEQVAAPHQLWKGRESDEIGRAIEWLRQLDREWSRRK